MELEFMLLANHAEASSDGLLYVSGGAWDTVNVAAPLPATAPSEVVAFFQGALVVRLGLHRTECGRQHTFQVVVMDEDGMAIGQVDGGFQADWSEDQPAGWTQPANLILNLAGLGLPRFGLYRIDLLVRGEHKGDRPFRVVKRYED